MKERIVKLIDIKSIVTIVNLIVFAYLSLKREISSEVFMNVFVMIIGFYFGTQTKKSEE